jgi:hypothetical protein
LAGDQGQRELIEAETTDLGEPRYAAVLAARWYQHHGLVGTPKFGGLIELLIAWMHGEIRSDLPRLVEDYVQLANHVGETTHGTARRR